MLPEDKLAYLSSTALFQAIDSLALQKLLASLEWRFLAGGEVLFRAGDAGDAMYVVLSGRVRVFVERRDGTIEIIRELGRGESVGELALLTDKPRSATVRAIRDTELARISQSAFEGTIKDNPRMSRSLMAQIADRQSRGSEDTESKCNIRTIAVLAVDGQAQTSVFARRLADTLNRTANTLHLNEQSVSRLLPEPIKTPELNGRTTAILNALELDHRFVVYEASA